MHINTAQILHQQPAKPQFGKGRKENIFSREISFSIQNNRNQFKTRFFAELSVLISSGVDIKKSLEIIINGFSKGKVKEIANGILVSVEKGKTLNESLKEYDTFTPYDYYSIRIGEESGSLPAVLKELSAFYTKKIAQQRQIRGALTYPILVLFTTIFSLVFMLNFIVPMFEDVFSRFHGNLPMLTKMIVAFSDSFPKYLFLFILILTGTIIIHLYYRKKDWYRRLSSQILLKMPIVGPIINLTYKTRFFQTLKLLISSKVHLLDALGLIRQMIGFFPMESALEDIEKSISAGGTFSEALGKHNIFDKRIISMTRVAEEVNKFEVVYEQIYLQYSEELDTRIKTMNNLLEPILIIFVGGLVALILISMYMPIFQLGTGLSQ
jgi:type IV pilus assembly protein PilC